MTATHLKIGLVLFVLIILGSCFNPNKEVQVKKSHINNAFLLQNPKNDSLVAALGMAMQQTIDDKDASAFLDYFDINKLFESLKDSTPNSTQLNQYYKGFINGIRREIIGVPLQIMKATAAGGSYEFIYNFYDTERNAYSLLFRLYSLDEGLNYHEYLVEEVEGQLKFYDFYIYTTGQTFRDNIRRIYQLGMPKDLLEQSMGYRMNKNLEQYLNAAKHIEKEEWEEAYYNLETISGPIKEESFYHVLKAQVTSQLGEEKYKETLKEIELRFKENGWASLMLIDYYALEGNYEKTMERVDKLELDTLDPFLNFIRGNLCTLLRRPNEALEYYSLAKKDFPYYEPIYHSIIALHCQEKRPMSAFEAMIELQETFEISTLDLVEFYNDLSKDEELVYSVLKNSIAYKNWSKIDE